MNVKMAAQVIRDQVDMESILDIYGYRVRHGFICCPFHGEHAPSLKVYKGTGGWHCFGCGRGGSVIDFVMEHENCNFRTAITAIDEALHLRLMDPHENPFKASRVKLTQAAMDNFVRAVNAYCDALIRGIDIEQKRNMDHVKALEDIRAENPEQLRADDWTQIYAWADNDQYDEYRKARIEEIREEVMAWRREARRLA